VFRDRNFYELYSKISRKYARIYGLLRRFVKRSLLEKQSMNFNFTFFPWLFFRSRRTIVRIWDDPNYEE